METCALKVTSAFLFGLTVPSITPAARPVKGCLSAGGVLYCPGTKQKGVYRHVPALSHRGKCQAGVSRFAIPFLGASLLQFLYGAVDLIVVGQFADQAGIAAVSTGSQVMQAVTNFIIGLSTGGTVLVGQYLAPGGGRT